MAFGFIPKYQKELKFDNINPEQFLVIAIDVIKKLDWELGQISNKGFIAYTRFSLSSWSEEVKVVINKNSVQISSECSGGQLIDWGKNKKNTEKFVSTYIEIKDTYSIEELYEKFINLHVSRTNDENIDVQPITSKDKYNGFLSIFKPTKGFFITPIIINLNITVFLLMVVFGANAFLPSSESLLFWGANFRPLTLDGGWWRLITNCFIHIGVFHLLMNLFALLYIGLLLEPYLGKLRFLISYVLTGIVASVSSLFWNNYVISAGASGAIFGLYGVFLALLSTNLIDKSARRALTTSIVVFVVYNLLNGLKGGIDNAAHIGGLLSGLLVGYAFYPSLLQTFNVKMKYLPISILTICVIFFSIFAYKNIPNDFLTYQKKIKEYDKKELLALKTLSVPKCATHEEYLFFIEKFGIPNWKECIRIANELQDLDLPPLLKKRNKVLLEYSMLRLDVENLAHKAVTEEDTVTYRLQFAVKGAKLQEQLDYLTGKTKAYDGLY